MTVSPTARRSGRRGYVTNQPQVLHTSTGKCTDKTCLIGGSPFWVRMARGQTITEMKEVVDAVRNAAKASMQADMQFQKRGDPRQNEMSFNPYDLDTVPPMSAVDVLEEHILSESAAAGLLMGHGASQSRPDCQSAAALWPPQKVVRQRIGEGSLQNDSVRQRPGSRRCRGWSLRSSRSSLSQWPSSWPTCRCTQMPSQLQSTVLTQYCSFASVDRIPLGNCKLTMSAAAGSE